MTDARVRVVVLDSRTEDAQLAWAIWTLCHLRYPPTWALEAALVETDGLKGERRRDWGLFQNCGTLVDVHKPATRILFVVPTDVTARITFGGTRTSWSE